MNFREKIITFEQLPAWREKIRARTGQLVVTNGCFDLLHVGHVTYLESARNAGQALLVGVNGDAAVSELKGQGRPINNEQDRAGVIAAVESVTGVCIFPQVRAVDFLAAAKPDIYVKGGDYTLETLNQEERRMVETNGGRIIFIPFVPGKSTSSLVEKITRL